MKRRTKLTAVLVASAALSAGAAFTALADWQQINSNDWIYTDSRGNRITDSWRQSGEYYFYLDSNGIMAKTQWIDDTYYVNEDGARLSNQWIWTEDDNNAPGYEGGWFYLGSNGQTVKDSWQTINGKRYHFNYEGRMDYGWLTENDNLYYLGEESDGAARTGWICLDYEENYDYEDGETAMELSSGGTWFYFQENGRAVRATGSSAYVSRTINGYRYYFDENGAMASGWVDLGSRESGDSTGISTLKYFGGPDEGQMVRGWRYLYDDPEDSYNGNDFNFGPASSSNVSLNDYDDYDSGDGAWYYFDNSGTPAYLSSSATTLSQATTRINSQRYFFDAYGRMQSGLLGFVQSDGSITSAYFGADDSDGAMKTNRYTNVIEEDGERSTFYFNNSGGLTGTQNGYLYYRGKLVTAEEGSDFQVFEIDGRFYLVNEAGRIQTSNRTYRVDGEYRYEYDHGTIYDINDNGERLGEVTRGADLPTIAYQRVYRLAERIQ